MGMTVDKTIEFFNGLECHTPQAKDAREVAISTMRKYQKIEQIVSDRYGKPTFKFMDAIVKVVEDGKDN